MTHQFDMMLGDLDPAVLERATEQLPKAREVEPRLPLQACMHPVDALKVAGVEFTEEGEARAREFCDELVPYEPVLDTRTRDHR